MLTEITKFEDTLDLNTHDVDMVIYKQKINEYDRWIVCCDMLEQKKLKDKWQDIVDEVAIELQSNISEMISKMNVYIIFFVESLDDILLKTTIENNRYSSRKIVVISKMSTISDLGSFIQKRLFDIDISTAQVNKQKSFEDYFIEVDKELYDLSTSNETNDKSKILSEYIKSMEVTHE